MNLGCCGIDCGACGAFIANRDDNQALRVETAAKWTKDYNHAFKPEDINCTGCRTPGVKVGHCQVCAVRACAVKRGMAHCGVCPDFGCKTFEGFLKFFPSEAAKANRQRLRPRG